jgi:O-antigen ligase
MIGEHPILGVGLNNYSVALPQYAGPEFTGAFLSTVHNKFVLTWAETGIFALVALLAFLGAVLTAGFRLARSPDPVIAVVAIALTAGLVGQLIHMNVDIFKGRPQIQLLFLVGAVMSAMSSSLRRPASSLPRRGVCR